VLDSVIKKTINALDIPWAKPFLGEKEKAYLTDALASAWISGGPYVERFEHDFSSRMKSSVGVAASSGTAALQLAVTASGLGPGDEVIVPGFSFAAPVNVVLNTGATPVYADVDPWTWCIDPVFIEKKVTSKTKAIIVVHIYGNVCDMDAIMTIARKHQLTVIEDAAEAAFSKLNGRFAGTWGDAGVFSFQATKTITTGEGGFVLSLKQEWLDHMRLMRDHGMSKDKRYWHDVRGFNFRLTNLQAAVGCAQLDNIQAIIVKKQRVYEEYCRQLHGIPGVTMQEFKAGVAPVVWAVALRLDPGICRWGRDDVMNRMGEEGIETRPGFYPFSAMPLYRTPALSVASRIAGEILILPSFTGLTSDEISRVCDSLKKAIQ